MTDANQLLNDIVIRVNQHADHTLQVEVNTHLKPVKQALVSLNDVIEANAAEMQDRIKTLENEIEQLKAAQPVVIQVQRNETTETRELGIVHKDFRLMLELMTALDGDDRNLWVTGPAGSGKTTGARQLSEALGLPFYFNGAIDTEYKLSGFIDAAGNLKTTAFRKAWEGGGVYLFDECDASMAPALLAFNGALANGHASFPDGAIKRHPDCYVIAAANTWGFGSDSKYIGRNKMDAAFMDRFITMKWEYDEALERKLARHDAWVDVVHSVRRKAAEVQAQVVISPRSSIKGGELLNKGVSKAATVTAVFSKYREHPSWSTFGAAAERFGQN